MGRCVYGGVGGPWAAAAMAGPYPVSMSMTPTCGARIAPDRPHSRVATHRRIGQRGNASRAICESHRHLDPHPALGNLLGGQIVNFDEDPPLACGKLMENYHDQQN